jgi:hypothetical protein
MDRACGTCGENRGAFRVVVGNLKKGYHLENRYIMEDNTRKGA